MRQRLKEFCCAQAHLNVLLSSPLLEVAFRVAFPMPNFPTLHAPCVLPPALGFWTSFGRGSCCIPVAAGCFFGCSFQESLLLASQTLPLLLIIFFFCQRSKDCKSFALSFSLSSLDFLRGASSLGLNLNLAARSSDSLLEDSPSLSSSSESDLCSSSPGPNLPSSSS